MSPSLVRLAARPRVGRFGISSGDLPHVSNTDLNTFLNTYAAMGATWVRFDFLWPDIQPSGPGTFDWAKYETTVAACSARGIKVLGILTYSPPWARATRCSGTDRCQPRDPDDFAAFAGAAAAHFAPLGVHHWEIWNEPNVGDFSTLAAYVSVLQGAYNAIKAADPRGFVLTAGTAPAVTSGGNFHEVDWLTQLYANGGGGYFDAVAHHPYCWGDPTFNCPSAFAEWSGWSRMADTSPSLRSVMIANDDGHKKIWATEFGIPTGGGTGAVTEAAQALVVADAYRLFSSYNWAGPLFWYGYRDLCTTVDPECYFGLVNNALSPKPAYTTFQNIAHSSSP